MAIELDYMEYANDTDARAAYVTSPEENYETGTNGSDGFGDFGGVDYWLAGKIVTSREITSIGVSIYLATRTGTIVGDWTYRLETDAGTEPSGTLAHANATGIIANADITDNAWNLLSFTGFTLSSGTYWIVCYLDDQTPNNGLSWLRTTSGGTNTRSFSSNHGSSWVTDNNALYFRLHADFLQCYSEDTIKEQGTYSLKGIAAITGSLNETLTRTIGSPIDLTDQTQIKYDIRGSRTGSQIKIGIHDSGGTTSEHTANIASANTFQTETWDISGISNANKDVIDSIIITIVNADAENIFYVDNMYAEVPEEVEAVNSIFFGCNF